jgi:hypothetical protein
MRPIALKIILFPRPDMDNPGRIHDGGSRVANNRAPVGASGGCPGT